MSDKSAEQAFWSVIDDGPDDEEHDANWFWDQFGHSERAWQE